MFNINPLALLISTYSWTRLHSGHLGDRRKWSLWRGGHYGDVGVQYDNLFQECTTKMFIVPIFMPTVFHNGNPSTKMIYRAKIHKNNLNQIANVTKRARLPTFVLSIVDNFMLNAAVLNGTQSKWLRQSSMRHSDRSNFMTIISL